MLATGHDSISYEKRYVTKQGHTIWCDINVSAVHDADGKPKTHTATFVNITERRQAEAELRESETNFRTFFESMNDLIVVGAHDGRIIFTNSAFRQTLGYTTEDVNTMQVLEVHPPDIRDEAAEQFSSMFRGERTTCPLPLATKSGSLIPAEIRVWFGNWSGTDCIFEICKD